MKTNLQNLITALKAKKDHELSMIIGLDGSIDEIVHPVDERQDFQTFTRIPTMTDFSQRIARAAGLSTNVELVSVQTKLGGNGPILSNALLSYGVKISFIGNIGEPIHPVFRDMADKCEKVYTLGQPAYCLPMEFYDGKFMLNMLNAMNCVTWEKIKEVVGTPAQIAALVEKCDLLGLENWTELPYMSQIWKGFINEVFPLLPDYPDEKKPIAFFDLADPEKRTRADIVEAMELIGKFGAKFRAILGLNEKELYGIAEAIGVEPGNLKDTTMAVRGKLGIYCLVAHPVKEACCSVLGEYFHVMGPYVEKPLLTTGAGDNFNAGFTFGMALGLEPVSALTLGVCTSGFYVSNAKSPTFDEVVDFADKWSDKL